MGKKDKRPQKMEAPAKRMSIDTILAHGIRSDNRIENLIVLPH